MQIEGSYRMGTIKLLSLLSLVVFFSTNYYGGNSLFFLPDSIQYLIKIISGTLGFLLLFVYFVLKNKHKRELINRNGVLYTKEALESMADKGILEDSVEEIISHGSKKRKNNNSYYTSEVKAGEVVTIVMNSQGHVLDII